MAVEAMRACGYRKVGGLYLVAKDEGGPCCKLPMPLDACPTCGTGIRFTRGWTWLDPKPILRGECQVTVSQGLCPASDPQALGKRVGLLWVGERDYPTAQVFSHEAHRLGISKRIARVPKELRIGETWVLLAHRKCVRNSSGVLEPGVFKIFQPEAVEVIVSEAGYNDLPTGEIEKCAERGIRYVKVPDDDPDHMERSPRRVRAH